MAAVRSLVLAVATDPSDEQLARLTKAVDSLWRSDSTALELVLSSIVFDEAQYGHAAAHYAAGMHERLSGRPEPMLAGLRFRDGTSVRAFLGLEAIRNPIPPGGQPVLLLLACDASAALKWLSADRPALEEYLSGRGRAQWPRYAKLVIQQVLRLADDPTRQRVLPLLAGIDPRLAPTGR